MGDLLFNFHNITGLQITTQDALCQQFFAAEYRPYQTPVLPSSLPRVEVVFRRGAPAQAPEGWPRWVHKVLARWAYQVRIKDNRIVLQVQGNRWAIPMMHHMLVHPSLRLMASMRGVLMFHAGAVVCCGKSLIFTGQGGAGKTTTVSALLEHTDNTWALHADDYVFLSPEGRSFSYLTRAHLYWPLLRWVPSVGAHLTREEKARLWLLGQLRRWSGERLKWPVRHDLQMLWPQHPHQPQAQLGGVIWLRRSEDETRLEPLTPAEEDIEALLAMNFFEARHFIALLHHQGDIPESVLDHWKARESEQLRAVLQRAPAYTLFIAHHRKGLTFLNALKALVEP